MSAPSLLLPLPLPLPDPPIPAEVDLRGNEWFPLYHQRLAGSVWWRTASHLARSCNIDLWLAAYRQVPAGSLPDNDRELAVACNMHRDMDAFRAAKAELMEAWTLCADGRWYQPVLAEIALDAWERLSERRRHEREKKARQRQRLAEGACGPPPACPPGRPGECTPQDMTGQDTDSAAAERPDPEPGAGAGAGGGWLADEAFIEAWDACTRKMRMRSRSRDRTWPAWRRAASGAGGGERLLAAVRAYLRQDADVERTGGPGFHKWLTDGVWEHWLGEETGAGPPPDPLEEWRLRVGEWRANGYWPGSAGPRPGEPGCRCPGEVLAHGPPSTA